MLLALVVLVGGGLYLASVVGNGTSTPGTAPGGATSPGTAPKAGATSAGARPALTAEAGPPRPGTTTISFITSPVSKGGVETVKGLAVPAARCTLAVSGEGKPINPPGLKPTMQTDAKGEATWDWQIDASYAPGTYDLKLACSPGAVSTSSFTVK